MHIFCATCYIRSGETFFSLLFMKWLSYKKKPKFKNDGEGFTASVIPRKPAPSSDLEGKQDKKLSLATDQKSETITRC